ncbi:S-antigen; retina and pineal gland (arrestin) a isoform X1 [Esox lucius]|uniref:S-arrestin n=2 Tax=Esox lucius TaxID=8010 RepID=A0A3P8YL39_ESOLU|nr:S-antigen; retina and pineal gland (arrestin) a isoform X1 [Esox lucius]
MSNKVVFKKIAKDKSVGVYMAKRDFVDHVDFVDPVDGVILVDPEILKRDKAFVQLSCTFRYGRDDMDVMGIAFRREIFMVTRQVYPPIQDKEKSTHSKMQSKLLHKLGNNAYPFFFEFPDNLPCSVALQPGPKDTGKHCAVEFEVKAFSAESRDAKVRKRSSVRLMIRKVQYAPEKSGVPPCVEISRDFVMSEQPLHLEASLDKETYYHGEPINVRVNITNNSNKNIKDVIVSVDQVANVVLYSNDSYVRAVALEESGDAVVAGASLKKVYTLTPLLICNKERRGIALDGKLKHQDTNLASSSIVKEGVLKEILGILVSYRVMVKLIVGGMMGSSEVGVELPILLMHPKPDLVRESELEEEMVFEDFKRSYLKGAADDEEEGNVSADDATS